MSVLELLTGFEAPAQPEGDFVSDRSHLFGLLTLREDMMWSEEALMMLASAAPRASSINVTDCCVNRSLAYLPRHF